MTQSLYFSRLYVESTVTFYCLSFAGFVMDKTLLQHKTNEMAQPDAL